MLKKNRPVLFLLVMSLAIISCSSDKRGEAETDSLVSSKSAVIKEPEKPVSSAAPTIYYAIPDTALLGKSFLAKVKVNSISVILLQNPQGKTTGSEATVDLSIINKSTLANKKFFSVSPGEARLELDNGQLVPVAGNTGKTDPGPEKTSNAEWKFDLPANTVPKKLQLDLDGTKVSLTLQTK